MYLRPPLLTSVSLFAFALLLSAFDERPGFFDPDGYYFPAEELSIGDYALDWIDLHTLEYYYDGAHHDKPRFLTPTASVLLRNRTNDKASVYDCTRPVINPEKLYLKCLQTPLGILTIQGTFLDKRGQFWNRSEIKPKETVVAEARVIVQMRGKSIYSKDHKFTYWEGD